ncbi:hypothetical protein [Halodesulfovibrio sp.]|uniref:hypothetical protein n=1 Tax=Halodesulfovibrio sp. TaxID=1912772 RepID=UPI0025C5D324|nr:hypothetical protein [Halodesulfovibrio sp.]
MPKILLFKPRHELGAQGNLDAFIAFARNDLTAFGSDLDFDSYVWDITKDIEIKGKGNQVHRIYFTKHHLVLKKKNDKVPFSKFYLSFAQAYLRSFYTKYKVQSFARQLEALRMLEIALTENGHDVPIIKINADILNRTAQLLKQNYSPKPAYGAGKQLKLLADFLVKKQMLLVPLDWKSPIKRPVEVISRCSKEAEQRRKEKMPSEQLLEALSYVYVNATTDRQILISSIAALLCSAPDRINEVLILHKNCEVDGFEGDQDVYGHSWRPAKGAKPMVKWKINTMIDTAKEAIENIRQITDPARQVAEWYYDHPDKIYLLPEFEYLRNKEKLTFKDVAHILWGKDGRAGSARDWCVSQKIARSKVGNQFYVCFADVEKHILEMMLVHFPYVDNTKLLLMHEAMMLCFKGTFGKRAKYVCLVEPITIGQVNDGLGIRSKHGKKSIFDEFDLKELDGSPLVATTHTFRHYLNTVAKTCGVGELRIAKWSGRKNLRQNADYDHSLREDELAKIRNAVGNLDKAMGPIAAAPKKKNLITRSEFSELEIATAHTTAIGYCVRNFVMSPCTKFMDCINCNEHVCIKGDIEKTARIRQQLQEAEGMLQLAIKEVEYRKGSPTYCNDKIDRWLDHHSQTVMLLTKLVEIMDDPNVPLGTVIQLSDAKPASRIEQATNEKKALEESEKKPRRVLKRGLAL